MYDFVLGTLVVKAAAVDIISGLLVGSCLIWVTDRGTVRVYVLLPCFPSPLLSRPRVGRLLSRGQDHALVVVGQVVAHIGSYWSSSALFSFVSPLQASGRSSA